MSSSSSRLHLSATQLVASALAAVTATVAASFLGIAGTVIGAAVASVVTVIGNAVYSHSIARPVNGSARSSGDASCGPARRLTARHTARQLPARSAAGATRCRRPSRPDPPGRRHPAPAASPRRLLWKRIALVATTCS